MLHPNLPELAALLPGRDDAGKAVIVNTFGSALTCVDGKYVGGPYTTPVLVNMKGTVVVGPYIYPYIWKEKIKTKKDKHGKEKVKYKEEQRISQPFWYVKLEGCCGITVPYTEKELTFPK